MATLISDKYEAHKAEVNARFDQLRANEEELNRIFAEIYDMEGEVPIEVEDKYVSVARIFDTAEEVPGVVQGQPLRAHQARRGCLAHLLRRGLHVRPLLARRRGAWCWPTRATPWRTTWPRCPTPRT